MTNWPRFPGQQVVLYGAAPDPMNPIWPQPTDPEFVPPSTLVPTPWTQENIGMLLYELRCMRGELEKLRLQVADLAKKPTRRRKKK